jgi:type II protein arginine methyltransferase
MSEKLNLDSFIARAAENPLALARLAGIFWDMGDQERAREIAGKALRAAPHDGEVRSLAAGVLSKGLPSWYFTIMRDEARNAAYLAALKRAVTSQTTVLEIGTGSGLFAMMAARAGAKSVVTCEKIPAVAEVAREIIALNGFGARVRVVVKKSDDLDPDTDMSGPADLLVSDIVGNTIVGGHALPAVEHAARFLLKRGAKIIPARGIIRVALANDAEFDHARMATIGDFDLSPFNRLAASSYRIRPVEGRLTLLSPPADLFEFNFQCGGPFPAARASATLISAGGQTNGVAQWLALQMDEQTRYENNPAFGTSWGFGVMFWPLTAPRDMPAETPIEVWGSHDRRVLRIWA